MPVTKPFKLREEFENEKEFENYKLTLEDIRVDHSKRLKFCEISIAKHDMRRRYASCINEKCLVNGKCARQYKILSCSTGKISLYEFGEHTTEILELARTQKIGCSKQAKEKIEECLANHLIKPKQIHVKLSEEPNWKDMPTLLQVQTFVKNRLNQMGNTDNMEELKEYLKTIRYVNKYPTWLRAYE
jgi:hypothetical protein